MPHEDKGSKIENQRQLQYNIDPLFIERWSPRAIDPTPLKDDVVKAIFEAARWSMSCYGEQPWLFLYTVSEPDRKLYLELLVEFNQQWAKDAPLLGFIFAKRRFSQNDKPNDWAGFDCGAAWMALTIQARKLGLYTHGIGGFYKDKVYEALGVPETDYDAICAFTVGAYGDRDKLPEEMQKSEQPSERKPLDSIIIQGKFNKG